MPGRCGSQTRAPSQVGCYSNSNVKEHCGSTVGLWQKILKAPSRRVHLVRLVRHLLKKLQKFYSRTRRCAENGSLSVVPCGDLVGLWDAYPALKCWAIFGRMDAAGHSNSVILCTMWVASVMVVVRFAMLQICRPSGTENGRRSTAALPRSGRAELPLCPN